MEYRFIPFLIPLGISAVISAALSAFGLLRRSTRGAKELAVCGFLGTLWIVGNGLEMAATTLSGKLLWSSVQYFAYAFSPLSWLALVFRFSGKDKLLTARVVIPLAVIPLLTSILVWFDPWIGLVRHSFSLDTSGEFPVLAKNYGLWFYIHYAYSYAINLTSILILMGTLRKKGSLYRKQSVSITVGLGIIFAANLGYVLGFSPVRRHDITPVVFGVSALILWWGIFRFRIFKLQPIARSTVFESMMNGILVLDEDWNLIDSNDSARRMLELEEPFLIGKDIRATRPFLAEVLTEAIAGGRGSAPFLKELKFAGPSGESYLELHISHLQDKRYEGSWVVVIEDTTELERAREKIIHQREELAAAEERERLSQELHDNLGQVLSFAVIQTDAVLLEMDRGNRDLAVSYLNRLREIVRGAHDDLRSLVRGIREAEYQTVSVDTILNAEAENLRKYFDAEVTVFCPKEAGAAPLAPIQKAHLARILKEALNNAAKHSGASRVSIHFSRAEGRCELRVEDNGVGIKGGPAGCAEGSGLSIMAQRARKLGGELAIEEHEGGGLRIVVRFPEAKG
jgi:signal transduction histidine kinase